MFLNLKNELYGNIFDQKANDNEPNPANNAN